MQTEYMNGVDVIRLIALWQHYT